MKPKKLIRKFITEKLKEGEWETITDQDELNRLYAIKVREELAEIQASDHKDIMEFVDLIQVAFSFAKQNGFTHEQLSVALIEKSVEKGSFGRLALNNLNPDNPSNKIYFEKEIIYALFDGGGQGMSDRGLLGVFSTKEECDKIKGTNWYSEKEIELNKYYEKGI